jgi:hypothetical protein
MPWGLSYVHMSVMYIRNLILDGDLLCPACAEGAGVEY